MRADEHEADEKRGVEDHAILRDWTKDLGQQRKEHGGEDHAEGVAHAAEDDHHDDFDGAEKIETARVDREFEVSEEPAGDAREERGEREGDDLVAGWVEPGGTGGDLVVAHGEEAASVGRVDEATDGENRHGDGAVGPRDVGERRHAAEPDRATERGGVLKNHADDFAEAECDEGEVVAFEA